MNIVTPFKKPLRFIAILIALNLSLYSCQDSDKTAPEPTNVETAAPPTPQLSYRVIATHPHDSTAFVEGFEFFGNKLLESTGSPENLPFTYSAVRELDLTTGRGTNKIELDKNQYFGEGITVFGNQLYQLTYKSGIGFIYDAKSYSKKGEFRYSNAEGWGLTHDSTQLIMSDGTGYLTVLNPKNLERVRSIEVQENNYRLNNLNELEYVDGYIYANIWLSNAIVKIDAQNGKVVGRLDLYALKNEALQRYPDAEEMNGIAYNPVNKHFYVTGKLWPMIFEIEILP